MKDADLVRLAKTNEKYRHQLYFRYEKLCYKHLHILERQLNYSVSVKEDFMADTYEVFLNALSTVKLSQIKNDKWLFLGWFGFYLKNLRIKYMNDIIKKNSNETSLVKLSRENKEYFITDVVGLHASDVFNQIDERLTYEVILKQFTDRQRTISSLKEQGFKNSEIASQLKVSNTLITFELQKMKKVVESNLL